MSLHKTKNNEINLKNTEEIANTIEENIKEESNNTQETLNFPENFLWGTSTSAYQIEGGIKNDWSEWEKSEERIKKLEKNGLDKHDFMAGQACDSYNRYEEDFKLAKQLNTNAIRFGIEWARIEPKKDTWNIAAIDHYRKMLQTAREQGFTVVLTIWHWTNPTWVVREGGWENEKTIEYYNRFVELATRELGAYVDYWVTLNEPMVHVCNGHLTGKFPPGKKSLKATKKVFNNLAKAHILGYETIHKHFPQAKVSITALLNYFEPACKWNPLEILLAKTFHYFWNHKFLARIKDHLDYIGLDYYFHDRMVWYPPFKKNKNKQTTDMGWEIYPKGIYEVLKYLKNFNKPIIILENGLADEEDKYRAEFIKKHLQYIHKAIEEGIDVRGYFHWSLLDNFEWAAGFAPKFGLFAVNRETFERQMRPSAKYYEEICKNNKLKI